MSFIANNPVKTISSLKELSASSIPEWVAQLRDCVTEVEELLALLRIDVSTLKLDLDPQFGLRVPRPFIKMMALGDPYDPLLRQVLPLSEEKRKKPGFSVDPLMEYQATLAPGIIQKYHGRLLLITTGACAIHCRYCFRRNFPYADNRVSFDQNSLEAIRSDQSINEVIASGGDPLILTDEHLFRLLEILEAIPHVKRLRIHTRFPVVIPARLTQLLIDRLHSSRLRICIVLHVNHPNEIGNDLKEGVGSMVKKGLTVLNQSVLLKGVNDDVDVLKELSDRLFEAKILPYYLHLLDPVLGTHHMMVEAERALKIYEDLRFSMPGYLVPKLARENPGERAKEWLS